MVTVDRYGLWLVSGGERERERAEREQRERERERDGRTYIYNLCIHTYMREREGERIFVNLLISFNHKMIIDKGYGPK